MEALLMSSGDLSKIADIIRYSFENPISMADLQAIHQGNKRLCEDDVAYRMMSLEPNIHLSYTVEQQPSGWMKHLSVLTTDTDKGVSRPMCEVLLNFFKFNHSLACGHCHVRPSKSERPDEVSIYEPMTDEECKQLDAILIGSKIISNIAWEEAE